MKKERWQRGETKKDSIMMTMLEKKEREKNRKALLLEVQTFEDEDDEKKSFRSCQWAIELKKNGGKRNKENTFWNWQCLVMSF